MGFKTVMSVCGVDTPESEISALAEFCRAEAAHLSLLVFAIASPPPAADYAFTFPEVWVQERDAEMRELDDAAKRASARLQAADISFDVLTEYVDPYEADDVIGLHARYSDLIVLTPSVRRSSAIVASVLEGALFHSTRPVLILADGIAPSLAHETVLLAWDSRTEAARAVYDAIPILKRANEVSITMIDPDARIEGNGEEPGADLATYLARHGIRVKVDRLVGRGRDTHDVIREHAIDLGAGLIVMGAYGHSRLRERIFGGVTRAFLDNPGVTVFMAH
ncbi:MAG TPA: universal stress protein [Ensifer sp.]|nr:universal stress protein [Ensifer sp.]